MRIVYCITERHTPCNKRATTYHYLSYYHAKYWSSETTHTLYFIEPRKPQQTLGHNVAIKVTSNC